MVEQGTHKPLVTGSNPVSATNELASDPGHRPGRSVFGLGDVALWDSRFQATFELNNWAASGVSFVKGPSRGP